VGDVVRVINVRVIRPRRHRWFWLGVLIALLLVFG
jgi:hypothetical protein